MNKMECSKGASSNGYIHENLSMAQLNVIIP